MFRVEYRTESCQAPACRQEPIHDTWLTWEEDRQAVMQTPEARGGDTSPEWPAVRLKDGECEGT